MKRFEKRLFTGLICLALCFGLISCGAAGGREETAGSSENAAAVSEDAEQTAAGSEDAEQAVADSEEEESAEEGNGTTDTAEAAGRQMFDTFTTTDLDGNEVTESIISQADVTFVNIWGTFCPPCIAEMPELEEISQSLPDNIQVIGLLCDVYDTGSEEYKTALQIVESTGVTYPSLIRSEDLDGLVSGVYAVPTSFFVNSEGRMLGEPIVGKNTEAYRERLDEYIAEYGTEE